MGLSIESTYSMALSDEEVLVQLIQARDNLLILIVEVTNKPKPNYKIDGQDVKWGDYLAQLQKALKDQNELIQTMGGPYEEHSTLYT